MEQGIMIEKWLVGFRRALETQFGSRLVFLGLQGSYGRGEQTDTSDIDAVVILDQMHAQDLVDYRGVLDRMEHRERICGFVAGRQELLCWERSDLLQLFLDTVPVVGSLELIRDIFSGEELRRAVLTGACQLYHACSHNFLHGRSSEILRELYKSARFVVRMKHYRESGGYISAMHMLATQVCGEDAAILQICGTLTGQEEPERFDRLSLRLLEWAGSVIAGAGEPASCAFKAIPHNSRQKS